MFLDLDAEDSLGGNANIKVTPSLQTAHDATSSKQSAEMNATLSLQAANVSATQESQAADMSYTMRTFRPSTATTRNRTFVTPVTLSPEERANLTDSLKNILNTLQSVVNASNPSGSDIVDFMAQMQPEELAPIVNQMLGGQVQVTGNMTTDQIIEQLKQHMNVTNEALSNKFSEMIKELSGITINSPDSLIGVLSTLNSVLTGSNSWSVNGGLPVSVSGNEVFIVGDIRPARLQNDRPVVMTTDGDSVGIEGEYSGNMDASCKPGPYKKRMLCSGKYTYRLENNAELISTSIPPTTAYRIQLWNASALSYDGKAQNLKNTSITAWIPIRDATLVMKDPVDVLDKMAMGAPFQGESLSFKTDFEGFSYTVTYGSGPIRLMDMTNDTVMVFYTAAPTVITSTGEQSRDLDRVFYEVVGIENMTVPVISSLSEVLDTTLLTVASGEVNSIEKLENCLTIEPVPLHVSGTVRLLNEQRLVLKDAILEYSGSGFVIRVGERVQSIEDAKWEAVSPSPDAFAVKILSGKFITNAQQNIRTVLNYADKKEAVIEGGQLIRNQTDGYVIKGGKISGDTNFGSFGSH
ncbi:hypothetical protein Aduo_012190 [Ancylostoma duodenale]